MSKLDIKEAYKVMQEASGIKVGDRVKVLRKAEDCEMGWEYGWLGSMDERIGEVLFVDGIKDNAVRTNKGYFPFFVLEVIEPETVKTDIKEQNMSKDKREIVSLRHKEYGYMVIGELHGEDGNYYYFGEGSTRSHTKYLYHIHRNLAAMPHEDAYRRCNVDYSDGYYLGEFLNSQPHWFVKKDGQAGFGHDLTFLDDPPAIKITCEINGKLSTLSEISEETLLNIRRGEKS